MTKYLFYYRYNYYADNMIIYLDLVIILNLLFDMLLLLIVNNILKRRIKIIKIFLGGLLGSLSILILFIKINNILLFIFKIIISILMILITFGYKNINYFIKNITYLYLSSIILGGFLYLLNIQFSYKNTGLIFYNNGLSINVVVLIIISPYILYKYYKETIDLKNNYNTYYNVELSINKNHIININAFLDTGNKLIDPYSNKSIVLVNKNILSNIKIRSPIYIPYNSLNHHGLLSCIKCNYIKINNKITNNILIGLSDPFNIDGIDCIINTKLMEDLK